MKRSLHLTALLMMAACSESKVLGVVDGATDTGDVSGDSGDVNNDTDTDADTAAWDGATLVVASPYSGDFLPLGEDAAFEATVYDADGNPTDFDQITWSTDLDSGWSLAGADVEDDSLDVGRHTITATAVLPNGDRLQSTMGGVLVQHEDAGTYVGNIIVNLTLTYDKVDYTAGCIGATTIVVDQYGETATGDSTCIISLLGYEQDVSYAFDMTVDEGDVGGSAAVDLFLFDLELDVAGEISNGELVGSWESADLVDISGELDAARISRETGE